MHIKVYFFGSLVDITAKSELVFNGFDTTDSLHDHLKKEYPRLSATKYFMAVNQKMIQTNCVLIEGDVVALMPPFSGG